MRNTLDDFAAAITNIVIESDEFEDTVGDKIEREVTTQIENLDLDNTIGRSVVRHTDEIVGRVDDQERDIVRLLSEVQNLQQSITDLVADNVELRRELDKANTNIRTLFYKLGRVWFIGWMFK